MENSIRSVVDKILAEKRNYYTITINKISLNLFNFDLWKKNKDDNIYKSEAKKWKDKTSLTLVECQNWISSISMHETKQNCKKICSKQLKYIILFWDMLGFFGLDCRDASLMTLNLVVTGISIPKIRWIG